MAELKWTVFYSWRDSGSQQPAATFSKLKVAPVSGGATVEKNKAWNVEAGVKSAEPQECKAITVVAESAEEACLVVQAIMSGQVTPEGSAVTGPRLGGLNNKPFAACLSSNLEEKAVG